MLARKNSLMIFPTFKTQNLTVKFPKHVRELKIALLTKTSLTSAEIKRLRTCKYLRALQTSLSKDVLRKPLYTLLCKLHQKTLLYFNTNGCHYYHIVRSPRQYELDIRDLKSWRFFFQKKSIRFLKMYNNNTSSTLSEKQITWILNNFQHFLKRFTSLREIEIAGNILNKAVERVVHQAINMIQKNHSNISMEIKAWDHNSENLHWLDTPMIRKHTNYVYFVNRCQNADLLVKPILSLPHFTSLQRLEFWLKMYPDNDFSSLKQLKSCKALKELRARFEFDVDLHHVSYKFLMNLKFPESLTYLSLSISGLRLFWVGDMPRVKELEADSCAQAFLKQFEKLKKLETLSLTLYEFRIEFSSLLLCLIKRLETLKELLLIMVLKDFDFKNADKYSILDFGFWCQKQAKVFSNLRLLSIEFPCLFIEDLDNQTNILQNIEVLSLGYRFLSKAKSQPKLNSLLGMLNPNKIIGLYLGDSNTQGVEEFQKRFEALAKLQSLQNITIAVTIKTVTQQLFDHFCWCIERLFQLRRFSCRLEKAVVEDPDWGLKLKRLFGRMRYVDSGIVMCKNGKIEYEK